MIFIKPINISYDRIIKKSINTKSVKLSPKNSHKIIFLIVDWISKYLLLQTIHPLLTKQIECFIFMQKIR